MKRKGTETQMREFFAEHPNEELTYVAAQEKFDATYGSVRQAVYLLRNRGLVKTRHVITAATPADFSE